MSDARSAPARRPQLVVLDVNETLSDLAPLGGRFEDVGAPAHLARTWFAGVLRDGFALTVVGTSAPFAQLAAAGLRECLHGVVAAHAVEDAVEHVLAGFADLAVHDDVPAGLAGLRGLGLRVVALSNGAAAVAEGLLERAGVRRYVEAVLSVEQAGVWKPAAASYGWALERCGVDAAEAMLVAVHPWDVDGAARAGLRTAWVDRTGAPFPQQFTAPEVRVPSLTALAEALASMP